MPSAVDRWGKTPADLKASLAAHKLAFPVLSSGNLNYQPADVAANIEMHLEHAKFVRDAGGKYLQVIDEKPKGRDVTPGDYQRLADAMNTLGAKTKALGVPLVYHHHMNSTGEPPAAIEAILRACDAASVGLLFDIAHYQQGGGDPVAFIREHGKAITVVHLKDVRLANEAPGYQWVELGRGRVDVKGCVAALKAIDFGGWTIVELDKVVDAGGTPRASAEANRAYVTSPARTDAPDRPLARSHCCSSQERRRRAMSHAVAARADPRSGGSNRGVGRQPRRARCGSRACLVKVSDNARAGISRSRAARSARRPRLRVVVIAAMRRPPLTTDRVRAARTSS